MYSSIMNNMVYRRVNGTNLRGIIPILAIPSMHREGTKMGKASIYLDMDVCITAYFAAAWLRPMTVFGSDGSTTSMPLPSSDYLIQ